MISANLTLLTFLEHQNYPDCGQHSSGCIWDAFQNIFCTVVGGHKIAVFIGFPHDNILLFSLEIEMVENS